MQPSYEWCINHRAAHTGCVHLFFVLLCFQEEILTLYDLYVQIHLRLILSSAQEFLAQL